MSSFLADMSEYAITSEKNLSLILSRFSTEYVFDVIKTNIQNRFMYLTTDTINIVKTFDTMFKNIEYVYAEDPEYRQMIEIKKRETYLQIIEILATNFNLNLNMTTLNEIPDLYSIAFYLYSLLVSDFKNNIVTMYTNYISKEKNAIYDSMNLSDQKKNKDTITSNNKRLYKNMKIAIIEANLNDVIYNMQSFDIDFETILDCIYLDKNMVRFISSVVQPNYDFFKGLITPLFKQDMAPYLISDIRVKLYLNYCIQSEAEHPILR